MSKTARLLLIAAGLCLAVPATAQRGKSPGKAPSGGSRPAAAAAKPDPLAGDEIEFPRPSETVYEPRTFSRAEIARYCSRYEGQVIAYYSELWKVQGCERRPIMDTKTVYEHLRSGKKVLDVEEVVVAAIPEGEPLDMAVSREAARGCRQLEGKYVTFSSVDVYFVERCKKRLFPDWATYIKHREDRGDKKGEIHSLSWLEFDQLEEGADVPSVIDDIFAKLLRGDAGVEVIPVDEACAGVEGRIASYYARLYRIERCRKREITDPGLYVKQAKKTATEIKVVTLTSEQWLSLPDGQPIEVAQPRPVETAPRQRR